MCHTYRNSTELKSLEETWRPVYECELCRQHYDFSLLLLRCRNTNLQFMILRYAIQYVSDLYGPNLRAWNSSAMCLWGWERIPFKPRLYTPSILFSMDI